VLSASECIFIELEMTTEQIDYCFNSANRFQ